MNWEYLRMPAVERHATMVYIEPVGTAPDNRLASHPQGYGVDTYTSFMRGVIDHLGVPRAYILGHSYAGLIAANFALAEPERTSGLILYASEVTDGPEFDTEAVLNFEKFVVAHRDVPGITEVEEAIGSARDSDDDDSLRRACAVFCPPISPTTTGARMDSARCPTAFG